MIVNGEHILTFKYDMQSGTEAVVDKRGNKGKRKPFSFKDQF